MPRLVLSKTTRYENQDDYQRERERKYPDTYNQQRPSRSSERDYNRYAELTEQANASTKYYNTRRKEENAHYQDAYDPAKVPAKYTQYYKDNKDRYQEEKAFYENKGELFPEQHERLRAPSAEAAVDTLGMASSRHHFLETHPYAYKNLKKRNEHEKYRNEAYDQAGTYDRIHKFHDRFAGDPNSEVFDKYGRRVPRG